MIFVVFTLWKNLEEIFEKLEKESFEHKFYVGMFLCVKIFLLKKKREKKFSEAFYKNIECKKFQLCLDNAVAFQVFFRKWDCLDAF